ncbi:MAG: hypothetical protein U9R20_02005 [Thermodesulfobacteriota bacterium]|nr:hypothetical protein [Thermodesulfobacteriota bacterium]
MTISAYRVESVLKAYSKQTRVENRISRKPENLDKYASIVTLSSENDKEEALAKISYSLVDILLKQK